MKVLILLTALALLSSFAASASSGGDTGTHAAQTDFFFLPLPRPLLTNPTLTGYRPPLSRFDGRGDADYHLRQERLGTTLALSGVGGMLLGAFTVHATSQWSGTHDRSDPRTETYLFLFFAGLLLMPLSLAASVTGLTMYGIHHRKRVRAEASY